MKKLLIASAVAVILAAALSASAEDVFPLEPKTGRFHLKRVEIVDGPDPIDTVATLYTLSGAPAPLPQIPTSGSPQSTETAVDVPGRRALVTWTDRNGGVYRAALAPVDDQGFLTPSWMSAPSAVDPRPSAAFLPDGTVVVVYVESDGSQTRAYQRRAAPPSGVWGPPEAVSLAGEEVASAHVTAHAGIAHIVYERRIGPTTEIVHATSNGSGFDREVAATSAGTGMTQPQIHSHAGVLWIDWIDATAPTGTGEVAWKRQGGGVWGSAHYEPFDSAFDREYHVRPGIRLQAVAP